MNLTVDTQRRCCSPKIENDCKEEQDDGGGEVKAASASNLRRPLSFNTKYGIALTIASLVLLLGLSVIFGNDNHSLPAWAQENVLSKQQHRRQLDEANNDDGNNGNGNNGDDGTTVDDYTTYSCGHLYSVTPDPGEAQCEFARTCNQGDGIWAPFVFCSYNLVSTFYLTTLMSPFVVVWLVLLFRMLGSTAEDYFSPSLEMFSVQMGLPPRFAGVTLLALGNGAADVSATASAITGDADYGYLLSLGALTGAAMFITGVVSSLVILAAGGVRCRGALVRDVCALLVTVLVVWRSLSSGKVGPETITLFLSLYATFVLLVLVADVYHRAVVVPRLRDEAQQSELQRQVDEGRVQRQSIRAFGPDFANDDDEEEDAGERSPFRNSNAETSTRTGAFFAPDPNAPVLPSTPQRTTGQQPLNANHPLVAPVAAAADATALVQPRPRTTGAGGGPIANVLTALSNYDVINNYETASQSMRNLGEGWGVESDDLVLDRPIMLHGAHGLLASAHTGGMSNNINATPSGGLGRQGGGNSTVGGGDSTAVSAGPVGEYSILEDGIGVCAEPGSMGSPAAGWREAWRIGKEEVKTHFHNIWEDIVWNGDLHPVDKFFLVLEYPFMIVRKLTVAIPCEGYYVRGVVALAVALSPLWLAYYSQSHGVDLRNQDVWISVLVLWLVSVAIAMCILRYAPGGEGNLAVYFAVPVALYGFAIAATWIDTIADTLVSVLNFIGIILGIPTPVLGLTLLAWGNSMSDMSANVTMARKGLGNMAMTACFAGPVFNILVGLGLGFSSLVAQTGVHERSVTLSPSVLTGFGFLALNISCILLAGLTIGKGKIVKQFGYVAITIYLLYLATSIGLQYSKYGDNE